MERSCHQTTVIMSGVHSRALNDCVWTNSVTLLSLPISVVVSTRIQMACDAADKGIMTFTIHYLFKHADLHTHPHFRSLLSVSCVGGQQWN